MSKIAITMGDPAGIGPEIILKALQEIKNTSKIILIGNSEIFNRNEQISSLHLPNDIDFIDIPFETEKIKNGIENSSSGMLSYKCLKKACDLANNNNISGIVTAPLSKNALNMAGYHYLGQTEILEQELSDNKQQAQMLFLADKLKILLLTRHVAVSKISQFITKENIENISEILNNELKLKFNIESPNIAFCALNPHAGENGLLGNEEIKIISPTIQLLKQNSININGPYSADTLLSDAIKNHKNPKFDAYIACYHDQALPAIKSLGLEKVLNITIGLKILRSSPSHGTAFDIAYTNKANYKSMLNAIRFFDIN